MAASAVVPYSDDGEKAPLQRKKTNLVIGRMPILEKSMQKTLLLSLSGVNYISKSILYFSFSIFSEYLCIWLYEFGV